MSQYPIRVRHARSELQKWCARIPGVEAHPIYGGFGRAYYPRVFGSRRQDESFVILADSEPLLFVACSCGEGCLDWYGLPMAFFVLPSAPNDMIRLAIASAFRHVSTLINEAGLKRIFIRDDAAANEITALGQACEDFGFRRRQHQSAICDLGISEEEMRHCLRRRYKTHVNWGERSLRTTFLSKENPDNALFTRYREFHASVAGRLTRPAASWDAMFEWIVGGHGEIVFGYLNDELVSAVMTVDGNNAAYYASGVFDRSLFAEKLPLAHWPIWLSILRAKARGLGAYDIGEVPQTGEATAKEVNIGFFKRGFASRIVPWTSWKFGDSCTLGVDDENIADSMAPA